MKNETPLQNILDDASDNQRHFQKLDTYGVDGICTLMIQGYSFTDICDGSDIDVVCCFFWLQSQTPEDRQKIQKASGFFLEAIENRLLLRMAQLTDISKESNEGEPVFVDSPGARKKQVRLLDAYLNGIQRKLARINTNYRS